MQRVQRVRMTMKLIEPYNNTQHVRLHLLHENKLVQIPIKSKEMKLRIRIDVSDTQQKLRIESTPGASGGRRNDTHHRIDMKID